MDTGLTRAEIYLEPLLQSELIGSLRRRSKQSLLKTYCPSQGLRYIRGAATQRAQITALKARARIIPEECQGTEGDLHIRVPSDSPHARMKTLTVDHELLAMP